MKSCVIAACRQKDAVTLQCADALRRPVVPALRGKDRAAPMDRPRDKKKVIRAPAVSASFCSTNLRREEEEVRR
ncbi:hypothetical protein EYF80_049016 [Liparis tanakae]|uniref:Uncharacterized protein n=1 Tax=Liparis tanakae TaxID=230148 RepID=A0A4Z2FJ55_9TELE|nr:hypothetical protein EYF80_049016 [Liparis tanakae]